MLRKTLAAVGTLAILISSSPVFAQSQRMKNRSPQIVTIPNSDDRCAIPLVRMPVRSNIDPINVLRPGPESYRRPSNIPSIVPVPSCDQRSELLPATEQHFRVIKPRRSAYRWAVQYHPAPLPQVLSER